MGSGIGRKILAFLLSFFVLLSVVLALPLFLIRLLVSQVAKVIYWRKIRKIITTRSSFFGTDDLYNFPKAAILLGITFDEQMDIDLFREIIQARLIESQLPNNAGLRYPELKEYIFPWFGYLFWRAEDDFKIEDHVRLHDAVVNEDAAFKLGSSMMHLPFPQGRSPWEYILVPHTESRNCTTLLRIHHALADGLSILKMYAHLSDAGKMAMVNSNFLKDKKSILKKCALPFQAVYDLSFQSIESTEDIHWNLPNEEHKINLNTHLSTPISMKEIKEIKKLTNSSFAGVVLASFAGAIRKFMLENDVLVPDKINTGATLPFPGHPEKLRNHLTSILVPLPLGDMEPRARLIATEKSLNEIRNSKIPIANFYGWKIDGALPAPIIKITSSSFSATTFAFVNFPGPTEEVTIGQRKMISMWISTGLALQAGVTCYAISYRDDFRIVIAINDAIVPQSNSASKLTDLIVKEIMSFKAI